MTTTVLDGKPDDLADLTFQIEELQETIQQLKLEDAGWDRITTFGVENADEYDRTYLNNAAKLCRAAAVMNPLMNRAVTLRTAFVWGDGVTISAGVPDEEEDIAVKELVTRFLGDPSNQSVFGEEAYETLERTAATDGNVFVALFTNAKSGRVQARMFPQHEVTDIHTNPKDRTEHWFYERDQQLYPALTHRQYGSGHGTHFKGMPINWDVPVLHTAFNRLLGWKLGIGDLYPALPWARGYAEFLQDWAKLTKALARVAWAASVDSGKTAQKVRESFAAPGEPGQVATLGLNQKLEAVNKTGATIDADSGRPLASLVAAAVDLPVTALLCDPGVTGARAVAETLDRPTNLLMQLRRRVWGSMIRQVLQYVIEQAVLAPSGMLRGVVKTDDYTGARFVQLRSGDNPTIEVSWPDLDQPDVKQMVEAIVAASSTNTIPLHQIARMLLAAFDVDGIDELLAEMEDDEGNWIGPDATVAAAALRAFRDGTDPASAVYA